MQKLGFLYEKKGLNIVSLFLQLSNNKYVCKNVSKIGLWASISNENMWVI